MPQPQLNKCAFSRRLKCTVNYRKLGSCMGMGIMGIRGVETNVEGLPWGWKIFYGIPAGMYSCIRDFMVHLHQQQFTRINGTG